MKKANKRPSEWLKLLCKDWAEAGENLELIETVDSKFESYKPYLKGKLSSQLLCRLCIPSDSGSSKDTSNDNNSNNNTSTNNNSSKPDFLRNVLNIQDEFDKAYVIAQVERFCALYDIRGIQQQAEANASAASAGSTNGSTNGNGNSNRFALPNNEATAAAAAALYGDLVVNAALGSVSDVHQQAIAAAAAATASAAGQQQAGGITIPAHFLTADATAAAVAAAQQAQAQAAQQSEVAVAGSGDSHKTRNDGSSSTSGNQQVFVNSRSAQALLTKAQQQAKSAERALEQERKQNAKREQRRLSQDKKLAKQRDREYLQKQKQAEKLAREKAREEKRTRKLIQRQQRELFAQEQKEAALRRAAELVASNRVPIEITRAGTFRNRGKSKPAEMGAKAEVVTVSKEPATMVPKKRQRSAIVVSTASDLDRIVTHSQNLWAKYNAIAKEHNQRVNWITVAKELGIHVKVREKYARMHSRACQRNFDFVASGHWKIKDHPEIFQEPTAAEQKARMPPPLPPQIDTTTTVVIEATTDAKETNPAANGHGELSGESQQEPQESAQDTLKKHESTIVSVPETNDSIPTPMSVPVPSTTTAAASTTTTTTTTGQSPGTQHHHLGITNSVDAAAAAATAAAVVDAAGVGGATIDMHHVVELTTTATAATATVEAGNGSGETAGSDENSNNNNNNNNGAGNASASDVVSFEL